MAGVVERAVAGACEELGRRAARYHGTGSAAGDGTPPLVTTFAALRAQVLGEGGESARAALDELCAGLARDPELDLPTFSRIVTDHLWRASGLAGPAVILGFASLPYLAVALSAERPDEAHVRRTVEEVLATTSAELGVSLGVRPFFQGISDMSFLGRAERGQLAVIAANTPPWGSAIRWAPDEDATAGLPTVNIGPWGRDYHQRLERVHAPYSFGTLPEVLWRVARALAGQGNLSGGRPYPSA